MLAVLWRCLIACTKERLLLPASSSPPPASRGEISLSLAFHQTPYHLTSYPAFHEIKWRGKEERRGGACCFPAGPAEPLGAPRELPSSPNRRPKTQRPGSSQLSLFSTVSLGFAALCALCAAPVPVSRSSPKEQTPK